MKRLTLLLALCALMLTFSVSASAADINFAGAVQIKQNGTLGTPVVNFTFNNLTVTPGTMGGDALEGTAVSITPDTAFSFTSISGSNGYFSPNSGSLTIGNATTGMLTGDIEFVTITGGSGAFAISISLNNVNITGGTSALLSSLVQTSGGGKGVFTFQFTTGGGASLNDLLNMGLGVGALAQNGTLTPSVSGSVSVPEPASLFLLGSGLLAGGGFVRRKLQR